VNLETQKRLEAETRRLAALESEKLKVPNNLFFFVTLK